MEITMLVCVILTTITLNVAIVYSIITMIQIKKTAKEYENLGKIINAATPMFDVMFLGGSVISAVAKKIKSFLNSIGKGGK